MPLVFVHGVNTRRGETSEEHRAFDNRVGLIKQQFAKVTFADRVSAPDGLQVFAPYWGDLGVRFARDLASLPQTGVQALGLGEPAVAAIAAKLDGDVLQNESLSDAPLVTLAKTRSLGAALDLLFAAAANAPVSVNLADNIAAALPDAAQFVDMAEKCAAKNPKPDWLDAVETDSEFLEKLLDQVSNESPAAAARATKPPQIQTLGVGDDLLTWLQNGVTATRRSVTAIVDALDQQVYNTGRAKVIEFSTFFRPKASEFFGRFVGDAFTYLERREQIIDCVLEDIRKAIDAKREGDSELYLIGHSFGGIILYDILSTVNPTFVCNLFVTVGSQVAFFAEIGRLADKRNIAEAFARGPTSVVPRPRSIERWLNVFDPTDFVGFGTRGVLEGAWDFEFDTEAFPLVSHIAYLDTPRFFARLRERVGDAFAKGTDQPLPVST